MIQLIQRQLLKSKTKFTIKNPVEVEKMTGKASSFSQNRSGRNGNQASLKAGVDSATGVPYRIQYFGLLIRFPSWAEAGDGGIRGAAGDL
jgi:hypothetical protein